MQIGYDAGFIGRGFNVPLPTVSRALGRHVYKRTTLRNGRFSDHLHFTVLMNEHTRQLIYSAYNIDQSKFKPNPPGKGKRSWKNDPNIEAGFQLNNRYYEDRKTPGGQKIPNPYDRGHMVMRFNNMWGDNNDESNKSGRATFIYSNSSLQHENLNRDEWKELELGIVRDLKDDANDRLCVFTGPIYGDLDRHVNLAPDDSARVPSGFFKVVCYARRETDARDKLGVLAFAIFQDAEVLRDKKGNKTVKTNQEYQVTISDIQDWTGINFGRRLYDANPLFYRDIAANRERARTLPERIPVVPGNDVVTDPGATRPEIEHLAERQIVVVSAMINPKGNESTGEWVSLHNRGSRRVTINNWRLVDGQGREGTIQGAIGSGESMRIKGNQLGKVMLSNSGGNLSLVDNHGRLVDYVSWSKPQVRRVPEGTALLFDNQNN